MKHLLYMLLLMSGSSALLSSCNKIDDFTPNDNLQIYRGLTTNLGNGKATAWISVNHLGAPVELGLELTREALYGLPDTNFSIDMIPLPIKAKELTPFDHIQIDWASHGHGMPGPTGPSFIGPHFDPRFYMTTFEERLSIPAANSPSAQFNVHPPAGYMPSNYFPGMSSLPRIGLHWTDRSGFTGMQKAMVLGTYNGQFTFISPIVTIEELRSGNFTSTPYAQPQYFQEIKTYYPTKYNIYANNTSQNHHITLSDFVLR